MKTLNEYIKESLLDIEGTIKANDGAIRQAIRQTIENWIKDNFITDGLKISNNPNRDSKYEVSAKYVNTVNRNITSLTNGMFIWKEVSTHFNCSFCASLTSLEGAPKEVGGYFDCSNCVSLKSLEGAPEKVGGGFYCKICDSLKSLEGAPKEVGGFFYCDNCDSLKTLKGAPKEIRGSFVCHSCKSLKTIDLPTTTKIKGEIYK